MIPPRHTIISHGTREDKNGQYLHVPDVLKWLEYLRDEDEIVVMIAKINELSEGLR